MKGGLLLDVVVSEGSSVLELLSGEDESLLVRWDALLVLDLGFNILHSIRFLVHIKGDGLASQGLDEDLHSSSKSKDQVKGGLLLDVVVSEGSSVLELLSGEDRATLGTRSGAAARAGCPPCTRSNA